MKVSVVGAYHNREAWVAESIRSVLDQSFEDFEFVVVDDGSTDGTAVELSKFDDERLRVIRQSNTGFRLAIRRAISESSGEIICIHAAGEIFLPDLLLRQVEILDSCPEVGCVSVQFRERDGNGKFGVSFTDHDFREIATLLLRMNAVCNGGATMRRSVFESVGGYREPFVYSEDYDLWLRLSEVTKFRLVEEVLFERVRIENGVSTTPSKRLWQSYLHDLARWSALCRRSGLPDPIETYGHLAIALRPPSRDLGTKLVRQAVSETARGDSVRGRLIAGLARRESLPVLYRLITLLTFWASRRRPLRSLMRVTLDCRYFLRRLIRRRRSPIGSNPRSFVRR